MSTATAIHKLIQRGALFVCNHSGGKDSQAMLIKLRTLVPTEQLLVIHAHLPGVEWEGTYDHVKRYAQDLEYMECVANKTFFETVEHRGRFPSPQYRQCTSDLKRTPIDREIRRYLKRNPQFNGLIVNCLGIRAQESSSRSKAIPFKVSKRNSIAPGPRVKTGREWYDWFPIFEMKIEEVFASIERAGQKPHWVYAAGMTRLSCCFCIMASKADLTTAANLNPELYGQMVALEKRIDQTMMMPSKRDGKRSLEQITGVKAKQKDAA